MIIVELSYGVIDASIFNGNSDWGLLGPWSWASIPLHVGDTYEFTGFHDRRYQGVITEIRIGQMEGDRYPGHTHYCRIVIPAPERI